MISIFGMTVHAAATVKLSVATTLRLSQPQEMCQKNCCRGGGKKKAELVLFLLSLFKVRNQQDVMKLCKETWLLTRITLLVNNKSINMFCWKFSGFVFSTFLKNTDTFTFLHVTSCSQHLFVTWFSYHEEEDDGEVAGGGCQTTDHSLRRLKVLSNRRSCLCQPKQTL